MIDTESFRIPEQFIEGASVDNEVERFRQACRAAIKFHMSLDRAKMEWLLTALEETESPMSCPHGRPVMLRYSIKELERAFHRT